MGCRHAASVGAGEDDAFGHLGEAGGDAVAEGGAELGGGEIGGDEGGEHVLVPVVDEPVGELLGHSLVLAAPRSSRSSSVQIGAGGRFPTQEATAEETGGGGLRGHEEVPTGPCHADLCRPTRAAARSTRDGWGVARTALPLAAPSGVARR